MDIEEYKSMSPEELRALNAKSGTLLLLDVPDGLEFGIDNIVWKTGNKFKGIKLIPMGAHIISYSLKDENHEFKINKFLFFDNFKGMQTQILIYKWCFKYSMFLELKGA
jgi:A1 cistron-splicing factor AAR2